jgi:replication fork protection complex subunit Tof1/Swi1
VTKWFLAFFRLIGQATGKGRVDVSFGVVAEITERGWISWVLKRMREAVEQKVNPCFCRCHLVAITELITLFL